MRYDYRCASPNSIGHSSAQLSARRITDTRAFNLDDIRAKPGEKLRTRRSRLHMREIQDFHTLKCLHVFSLTIPISLAK